MDATRNQYRRRPGQGADRTLDHQLKQGPPRQRARLCNWRMLHHLERHEESVQERRGRDGNGSHLAFCRCGSLQHSDRHCVPMPELPIEAKP